jgi:hypothetical protein
VEIAPQYQSDAAKVSCLYPVEHLAAAGSREALRKVADARSARPHQPSTQLQRLAAYWRPTDGSREAFLCAADADACGKHPHLRELLLELAAELALNRGRAAGDGVALRVRPPIGDRAGSLA